MCNPREGSGEWRPGGLLSVQLGSHEEVHSLPTQPDQAPGRTPCGFHSPPVLENVSSAAWRCRFLPSVTPSYFIYKCHTTQPGPGSVVNAVWLCLRSTKQSSDWPMAPEVLLESPPLCRWLRKGPQQVSTQKSPPVTKSLPLLAPHSRAGSDLHCKYAAHNEGLVAGAKATHE